MATIKSITEAVIIKVQETFGPIIDRDEINKDIIYAPDEIAQRLRAERTSGKRTTSMKSTDKYSFEFLNVWLRRSEFSWRRQRTSVARGEGIISSYVDENNKEQLNMHKAVPIDMDFEISLWTLKKERADKFIEEFCFLQQERPELLFYYNENLPLEVDFFIRPSIDEENTFASMFTDGKYWKPTILFEVEGWLIKDLVVRTVKQINIDYYQTFTQDDDNLLFSQVIDENS